MKRLWQWLVYQWRWLGEDEGGAFVPLDRRLDRYVPDRATFPPEPTATSEERHG